MTPSHNLYIPIPGSPVPPGAERRDPRPGSSWFRVALRRNHRAADARYLWRTPTTLDLDLFRECVVAYSFLHGPHDGGFVLVNGFRYTVWRERDPEDTSVYASTGIAIQPALCQYRFIGTFQGRLVYLFEGYDLAAQWIGSP